jgi:hypothetical protein
MEVNQSAWTLEEAIPFIRELESKVANTYHVGITGSVLYDGGSTKDLDVIVYPHHSVADLRSDDEVIDILGLTYVRKCEHDYDNKCVYETKTEDGRRVDLFIML